MHSNTSTKQTVAIDHNTIRWALPVFNILTSNATTANFGTVYARTFGGKPEIVDKTAADCCCCERISA